MACSRYVTFCLMWCCFVFFSDASAVKLELPFVVVICSYNNEPWVLKNLDSLFCQDYHNFRVIYVDDCSSDNTLALVRAYCDEYNLHDKLTIITNTTRCRKMHNIYKAYHSCNDDEIVVQLDGDDWLADDQVLSYLNEVYQNDDVWITYGSYQEYPSGQRGYTRDAPDWVWDNRLFRHWQWVYMHLRSWRAWLFKQVRLQDFITGVVPGYKSKFYPSSNDTAMMYPMLEMAGRHGRYINQILYITNRSNPLIGIKSGTYLLNTNRWAYVEQCKLEQYPELSAPAGDRFSAYENSKAALIIVAENQQNLEQVLASCEYLDGIGAITVISADHSALSGAVKAAVQDSEHEHIVLMLDKTIVKAPIDLSRCIQELEKTHAHAFYFGLSHQQAVDVGDADQYLYETFYAWKFNCRKGKQYNNPFMTLYNREALLSILESVSGDSWHNFLCSWQQCAVDERKIGLYFEKSKITIISDCLPEVPQTPWHQLVVTLVICFNTLLAACWYRIRH